MTMTPPPLHLLPKLGALIGDKLVTDLNGGEIEHVYAATGEPTRRVGLAGPAEVALAARTARQALPAWKAMSIDQRRRLMLKVAELIRAEADLKTLLPRWLAAAGDKLVNRSSTTWRALSDADKAKASGTTIEGLLLGNPTLIKRPVIELGGEVLVGWTVETKARIG